MLSDWLASGFVLSEDLPLVSTEFLPAGAFGGFAFGGRIHSVSASTAIRAATAAGQESQLGYPELARLLRRAGVAWVPVLTAL